MPTSDIFFLTPPTFTETLPTRFSKREVACIHIGQYPIPITLFGLELTSTYIRKLSLQANLQANTRERVKAVFSEL